MRCSSAIRQASIAAKKHSEGVFAATIGIGDSPCLPYIAISRSAASVFVGRPVDGPPRWIFMITNGSSSEIANPIVSDLRATPGPLVVVIPRCPPYEAPRAAPTAAISSSAWKVVTPKALCFASS